MISAAIELEHLNMVLMATRLRSHTGGRTCQLCALTAAPMLEVTCSTRQSDDFRAMAKRLRAAGARLTPLQRGDIARVFERTQRLRGAAEVRRTWRTGIKALRAEPRYTFNGGTSA